MKKKPKSLLKQAWTRRDSTDYALKYAEEARDLASEISAIVDERMRRKTIRDIKKFAKDPKNIHFDKLAPYMAKLIEVGLSSDLDDAYEAALRLRRLK